jgi:hypothetical protein
LNDDLLLPCPPWCTGTRGDGEPWHESRPVALDVLTGPVKVQEVAAMTQYPAHADPGKRNIFVWSHMAAEATMNQPSDVIALADMLTGHAARPREVADDLVIAQQQHRDRVVEADLKDADREGYAPGRRGRCGILVTHFATPSTAPTGLGCSGLRFYCYREDSTAAKPPVRWGNLGSTEAAVLAR